MYLQYIRILVLSHIELYCIAVVAKYCNTHTILCTKLSEPLQVALPGFASMTTHSGFALFATLW